MIPVYWEKTPLTNPLSFPPTDDSPQSDSYQQYNEGGVNREHEASFAHELIAGAASYEAAKAYEQHCDRNGKTQSYS